MNYTLYIVLFFGIAVMADAMSVQYHEAREARDWQALLVYSFLLGLINWGPVLVAFGTKLMHPLVVAAVDIVGSAVGGAAAVHRLDVKARKPAPLPEARVRKGRSI